MTNNEVRYEMMKLIASEVYSPADDFLGNVNTVYKTEFDNEPFLRIQCFGNAAKWRMLPYTDAAEYVIAAYAAGKVISLVIADKNTETIYDVGYETLGDYKQKGIATHL